MGITSALVLYAVIWFMILFIVLPLRLTTQGDAGEVVPGTHKSAPANFQPRQKVRVVTIWATLAWVIIAGTIWSGMITVRDFDWFDRMSTPEVELRAREAAQE
jgi:predicted secreted protein